MIRISTLDNIFLKRVVAVFIISVIFAVFAGICHFLSQKTIATALVSSRLDYCNSLLHNIAIKDITKLQRVKNCLARVVTRSPRFSRSVPLLKSLHWLPVRYRIIFKICTITYQALSTKQPAYLHSMLTPARQPRQLRSSGFVYFLFPELRQTLELELSRLPHQPCGIHSPTT